jgi:hypothetical protein
VGCEAGKFPAAGDVFFLDFSFYRTWRGRSEQISLDQVGCEAGKFPAAGDVFFLDFSFYRTTYKTAGTAKIRGSRTRHRMLWVGLWVGKSPRIQWQSTFSFPRNSFIRQDYSEAAVWKTAQSLHHL